MIFALIFKKFFIVYKPFKLQCQSDGGGATADAEMRRLYAVC